MEPQARTSEGPARLGRLHRAAARRDVASRRSASADVLVHQLQVPVGVKYNAAALREAVKAALDAPVQGAAPSKKPGEAPAERSKQEPGSGKSPAR